MGNRLPVKQQHERSVVADFISWLNARRGTRYTVIAEPDPPEAIIQSTRVTTWVEVVDAFWTGNYAQDVNSFATPGETHKPVSLGPHIDMDKCFAKSFVKALSNKFQKTSYLPSLRSMVPATWLFRFSILGSMPRQFQK